MTEREKYFKPNRGRDKRRRKPGDDRKRFEVDSIWAVHSEIIRRKVLGQKNTVIAKALGVSDVMVSYTVNSPKVQDKMEALSGARDAMTSDLKEEIEAMVPQALLNLSEIIVQGKLNGNEASLSLVAKESNNMIDRMIGKPVQSTKNIHAHAILTGEDIQAIKDRVNRSEEEIVEAQVVNQ